jgi:hypothetical protein
MLSSMHVAVERKEAVPLLDGARQNKENTFRHVNFDAQTKNFADSIADSMRSTGSASSFSSVLWGEFSSHERNHASKRKELDPLLSLFEMQF